MKALISTDWHVDAVTGGVIRLYELEMKIRHLVKKAIETKCDHFMFLGDFHDSDDEHWYLYQCLLFDVVTQLSNASIMSHWVVGNHDLVAGNYSVSTLSLVQSFTKVTKTPIFYYDKPTFQQHDEFDLMAMPYFNTLSNNDKSFDTFFKHVDNNRRSNKPMIVLSHMQLTGMVPGSESKDMAKGADTLLPIDRIKKYNQIVFQGHYHKAQRVVRDGVEILIVGSLARIHFDEEDHNPGYALVSL